MFVDLYAFHVRKICRKILVPKCMSCCVWRTWDHSRPVWSYEHAWCSSRCKGIPGVSHYDRACSCTGCPLEGLYQYGWTRSHGCWQEWSCSTDVLGTSGSQSLDWLTVKGTCSAVNLIIKCSDIFHTAVCEVVLEAFSCLKGTLRHRNMWHIFGPPWKYILLDIFL